MKPILLAILLFVIGLAIEGQSSSITKKNRKHQSSAKNAISARRVHSPSNKRNKGKLPSLGESGKVLFTVYLYRFTNSDSITAKFRAREELIEDTQIAPHTCTCIFKMI